MTSPIRFVADRPSFLRTAGASLKSDGLLVIIEPEFEGRVDEAGVFHRIPGIDDSRLAKIFSREGLAFLVGREPLSPEWAERILSWPHTGFNVHSLWIFGRGFRGN